MRQCLASELYGLEGQHARYSPYLALLFTMLLRSREYLELM